MCDLVSDFIGLVFIPGYNCKLRELSQPGILIDIYM